MTTLTDADLTRLLDEAASSYDVPEHGRDEVLAALAEIPPARPVLQRRWVQLSAAAAVITAGAVFVAAQTGGGSAVQTTAGTADRSLAPGASTRGDSFTSKSGAANAGGAQQYSSMLADQSATTRTSGQFGTASGSAGTTAASGSAAVSGTTPAAPAAPAVGQVPAVGAPAPDGGESRVVKTGSIALVVKNNRVTPTLTAVEKAAKLDGGYIADGTTNEYGDTPSGELSIRVPVNKFDDLVAQVRGLDAKVRTATTSGKDVTAAYSDLQSQLRTLKATRERFYLILTKTTTIGEILTVQQRIDNVSGQIDRIEGQRKLLASQSDLSTLTVSVSEAGDPVVKATDKPQSGLSRAFTNAKDGFVTGVEAIISHSGRALLWLLCLAAVALFARSGWRVARRRMV